jgi:hypothetical protein
MFIFFYILTLTNVTYVRFFKFLGPGRRRMAPDSYFEDKSLKFFFLYLYLANVIKRSLFLFFLGPERRRYVPDPFEGFYLKVKPSNYFFKLIY